MLRVVGVLGLAPSCPMATALQAASVSQPSTLPWRVVGWSAGLAPASTRVTASCLDCFGIDHSPPGRNRTFTDRLSGDCTTLVLQAGKVRRVKWPVITQRPVRPHGGPSARRQRRQETDKAGRQRIERCCPGFGVQSHPRWRPKDLLEIEQGASWCIREDSNLRQRPSQGRVPSLERIHGPSDWNRTSDNVVVGHVLCS